jgi:hypothetical protein
MNRKEQIISILDYWIEQSECVCLSDKPIGGCLNCDLLLVVAMLEEILADE